ncbi:MAG: glycerol-3-phosphate 1-O-acyltransferase PlsY [Neisseriaceae bacterium]|nr:glycerol-3-phosphate 1-O-acyltransferase PlsY [Neisseriaceae bacterium]
MPFTIFIFALIAYFIGSLSFAVIVSRSLKMADPRTYGSNNPGATNVLRSGNKMAAALTLLGDGAKGWFAVFLAICFVGGYGLDDRAIALVGIVVLIGHMWPIFFGFKGGKGVATALGVLLALNVYLALCALLVWLFCALVLKISSLAAVIACICMPFMAWFLLGFDHPYTWACACIAALILYRHKENLKRLRAGKEDKINKP